MYLFVSFHYEAKSGKLAAAVADYEIFEQVRERHLISHGKKPSECCAYKQYSVFNWICQSCETMMQLLVKLQVWEGLV